MDYTDNNHRETALDFSIKEVLNILNRYKYSIGIITLLVTLYFGTTAYFSPDIYRSATTFDITSGEGGNGAQGDLLAMATTPGSSIENDIALMQSTYLAKKALSHLNLGTRYFTNVRGKVRELYKASPFVVAVHYLDPKAMGIAFHLEPLNENQFRLIVKPTFSQKVSFTLRSLIGSTSEAHQPIEYVGTHTYNQPIATPWFRIQVNKIHQLNSSEYTFSMVPNEAMLWLIKSGLSVMKEGRGSTIVTVEFDDTVPLRAKEVLDTVIDVYEKESLIQKTESASKKLQFIDEQLETIHTSLKSSSKNLRDYQAENVVVPIEQKTTMAAGKIGEYESQIDELNIQIEIFENALSYIEAQGDLQTINLGTTPEATPLGELIAQIQELHEQKRSLLVNYTELHPDVIQVTERIIQLTERLEQNVRSTLGLFKNRRDKIYALMEKQKRELETIPQQQRNLSSLSRDFMINEKIYSYLLEKRAETAIVESSKISTIQMIEPSVLAHRPYKPNRIYMTVVGFILGLVIGIAVAFIRAFSITKIQGADDIEKKTSIPLFGTLPEMAPSQMQAYYEALRVLRTNLSFVAPKAALRHSRLISFTSTVPGEGKTTTVCEIGKMLAKGHKRVVVVDLDLRRSMVHAVFDLDNDKGITTFLSGQHELDEIIRETEDQNLRVITAGPTPPNPSELLMMDELHALLDLLFERYDYVLLDTAPIGLVADAMPLMKESDITMVMLTVDYSKKAFIETINKFVEQHELHAGIVLNRTKLDKKAAYGYGYGAAYAYKESKGYY